MSSSRKTDLMNRINEIINEFKNKQKEDKTFIQYNLFEKLTPLFDSIIGGFREEQNRDGEFYQRKYFINRLQSFFDDLSNELDKDNYQIKETDKKLRQTLSQGMREYYESVGKHWVKRRSQDRKLLNSTIDMALKLLSNPEDHQTIMYDYGQQILSLENFSSPEKRFKDAQELVFTGIGLKLHALDLYLLDTEIKRVGNLKNVSPDRIEPQKKLVDSLNILRNTVLEDLNGMKKERYTMDEIKKSKSNQLAKDTAKALNRLTYQEVNQNDDEKILEQYAEENPPSNKPEKFFKALGSVGAVCIAGLGFIVGTAVGIVAGLVKGAACCGIGMIPGAIGGAVIGGVFGAEYGLKAGKWLANIPFYESIKRHLFFQPTPKQTAAMTSQKALAFINPNHPNLKPKVKENSTDNTTKDNINYETLTRYMACR